MCVTRTRDKGNRELESRSTDLDQSRLEELIVKLNSVSAELALLVNNKDRARSVQSVCKCTYDVRERIMHKVSTCTVDVKDRIDIRVENMFPKDSEDGLLGTSDDKRLPEPSFESNRICSNTLR